MPTSGSINNTTFDYPEDSVHVSGDYGAFVLAVRNDSGVALAADGDYIPFTTDASGALRVAATVSINYAYPEDSPHVSGDIGAFVLAVRNDTNAVLTSTDGDYSPFSVTSTGALNIADAGGSITVDAVDFDIRNLDCLTDSITVCQGTIPWTVAVSGTTPFSAAFEYAEDSPHVSGDIGAFVLAVRNDGAATVLTDTNGDYSPIAVTDNGQVYVIGNYTPSDAQANPTDLIGTESFNMVWGPGATSGLPAWSRWGAYGIDDDTTEPRVPGVAIFGRPELGLAEVPQQAGVISNLTDNADAFHALVVASSAHYRDGTAPVLGRQSDGNSDNNPNSTVGASGTMIYDPAGDNWDRWTGDVTVIGPSEADTYHSQIIATRYNQTELLFANGVPATSLATTATASTGTVTQSAGHLHVATGAGATGAASITSVQTIDYRPGFEIYVWATAAFTTGVANSFQRVGLYDATNGFFVGYEGTVFGFTTRTGGVDTQVAQAAFNTDTLTGAAGSKFTRNGVPEALNQTFTNLYRIRYGWFGSAIIQLEVFSPDGEWVLAHIVRQPNTAIAPHTQNPNLPVQIAVGKTAGATNINIDSGCIAGGITSDLEMISTAIVDSTLAKVVKAVLTGKTNSGNYVNVAVNPQGRLLVAAGTEYNEDTPHTSGDLGTFVLSVRNDAAAVLTSANGDYSPIAVDSAGRVGITDLGGSITTDDNKAEDSVHVSGDIGSFSLAVRNDAGTALAANGDYIPFTTDANGALWVTANGGTFGVTFDYPEDSASVSGDIGAFVLGVRNDTNVALTSANGDYGGIAIDQFGRVVTQFQEDDPHTSGDRGVMALTVRNDTITNVLTSANGDYSAIAVDSTGKVGIRSNFLEDSGHVSGDVGNFVLAVRNDAGTSLVDANLDYAPFSLDSTGALRVTSSATGVVTQFAEDSPHTSGDLGIQTLAVRNDTPGTLTSANGDYASIQQDGSGGVRVAGTITHDTAIVTATNSPILVASRAEDNNTTITSVAAGDVTFNLADLKGVQFMKEQRPQLLGIYYAGSGPHQLAAAADAATGGRVWLVNTSSTIAVALKQILFTCVSGTALVTLSFPRINVERMTFTGTPSGATIAPALRDSTDAAATGTLRTASTGMTITAGNVLKNFSPVTVLTAVGVSMPAEQRYDMQTHVDDRVILRQNEGIVVRQADAGTTLDTRRFFLDFRWEEYTL